MEKNKNFKNQLGFTLLEILVVLSMIGTIIAIGIVSYTQVLITSRDSARKSDIQVISSALEQYKSNNIGYPQNFSILVTKYINPIPKDPKTRLDYVYTALPLNCLATNDDPCNNYTLGTKLEKQPTIQPTQVCSNMNCGGVSCNFCLGPYGEK